MHLAMCPSQDLDSDPERFQNLLIGSFHNPEESLILSRELSQGLLAAELLLAH